MKNIVITIMIVLFAINEISAQIKTQTIDSKKVNEHIKLNKKSDIYTVVMPKLDIQKHSHPKVFKKL